eukprot:scaffold2625_cov277-Chaetoceros_neogracile.AAC.1
MGEGRDGAVSGTGSVIICIAAIVVILLHDFVRCGDKNENPLFSCGCFPGLYVFGMSDMSDMSDCRALKFRDLLPNIRKIKLAL